MLHSRTHHSGAISISYTKIPEKTFFWLPKLDTGNLKFVDWKGDSFISGVGRLCGCSTFSIPSGSLTSFCLLGIDVIPGLSLTSDLFAVHLAEWSKFSVSSVSSFCFLGVEVLLGLPLSSSFDFSTIHYWCRRGFVGILLSYTAAFKIRAARFSWTPSKNIRVNTENKVVRRPALSYRTRCMSPNRTYVIQRHIVVPKWFY